MRPAVEDCPFRAGVRREAGQELAQCRLIESLLGDQAAPAPIPRQVCEACCRSAPPSELRFNDVIASLLYREATGVLRAGGIAGCSRAQAEQLLRRAEMELSTHWSQPNHSQWTGPVPGLEAASQLMDRSVTCDTLAGHLRQGEPFTHVRYGDGEWLSILARAGRNADGHDFFPDTMGAELGQTLHYWAALPLQDARAYVGLQTVCLQDAIRRYLVENRLAYTIHWVVEPLYVLGLRDRSTLRFIEAVQQYPGLKILVAQAALAPVARGLRCRHVVIPPTDCYLALGGIVPQCRFSGPGLVLCCAGMAAECLLAALHKSNPEGTYIDCGHIFDIFVGLHSRDYTQANAEGIVDFLFDHYAPVLFQDVPFSE